jgi:hypothetical protein
MEDTWDTRDQLVIGAFLKLKYSPALLLGRRSDKWHCVTNTIMDQPVDDTFLEYEEWKASAILYVSIDIATHRTGVHRSNLEGRSSATARSIFGVAVCDLHRILYITEDVPTYIGPFVLQDLV